VLVTERAQGLLPGTVDVLILRTLAPGPMHGYGIARFVRERSGGTLTIESAALYQALHRLERKKRIRSRWGVSDTNRRAKFYELTAAGRKHLETERAQLGAYIDALKLLLEPG
jgi:PadR family transcriptional regulator, regulatory protein PadR